MSAVSIAPHEAPIHPLQLMQMLASAVDAHTRRDRPAARSRYKAILAMVPGHAQARQLLALVEFDDGNYADAARLLEAAVDDAPEDAGLHENLGATYRMLGQYEFALQSLDRAIALNPDSAMAHGHRGAALLALERLDESRHAYAHALALDPRNPEIFTWRGALAQLERQPEEALRYHDQALALQSDLAIAHNNRGLTLRSMGRIAEAAAAFERATQLSTNGSFRYGLSLCLLTLGDYERGWPLYEYRYDVVRSRDVEQPRWTGESSLAGKVLLLHHDEGLGDMILMVRFAAAAAAMGARVVLESRASLTGLLSRVDGVHQALTLGEDLPHFDLHCPLMSLPAVLQLGRDNIPGRNAYLVADEARVAQWSQRLGPKARPRIGIAWCGNPLHANDRHRSLALGVCLDMLRGLPAEFVSLQNRVPDSDVGVAEANPWLRRFDAQLCDFEETAALANHMDLIITVDTSIVHLAGALGRPTWLLPPFPPDIRWPLFEEDCPWYASVRMLWQSPGQGWAPLLGRVREQLVAWLDQSRGVVPCVQ